MEQIALFDYAVLDAETRIVVQQRTGEIRTLVRKSAQDIIEIGLKLHEVKERLGHGQFGNWLGAEFEWTAMTAQRFMQVADRFKNNNLLDLNLAPSALYLLAAPSTPDEAVEEALERADAGEAITHATAKEIVQAHKPAPEQPFMAVWEIEKYVWGEVKNATPANLRYAAQVERHEHWNNLINAMDRNGKRYRTRDVVQALNNVAQQKEERSKFAEPTDEWTAAINIPGSRQAKVESLAQALIPWIREYRDEWDRTWQEIENPSHTNGTFWRTITAEAKRRGANIHEEMLKDAIKHACSWLTADAKLVAESTVATQSPAARDDVQTQVQAERNQQARDVFTAANIPCPECGCRTGLVRNRCTGSDYALRVDASCPDCGGAWAWIWSPAVPLTMHPAVTIRPGPGVAATPAPVGKPMLSVFQTDEEREIEAGEAAADEAARMVEAELAAATPAPVMRLDELPVVASTGPVPLRAGMTVAQLEDAIAHRVAVVFNEETPSIASGYLLGDAARMVGPDWEACVKAIPPDAIWNALDLQQAICNEVVKQQARQEEQGPMLLVNGSPLPAWAADPEPEPDAEVTITEQVDLVPVSQRDGYDSDEWYTPAWVIEAARQVMDAIDLDPASCELAQEVVQAKRFLCRQQNGATQQWAGRVWLNPPYSMPKAFVEKLLQEYVHGNVKSAVVLLNNATETEWFQLLLARFPVCFLSRRLAFWRHDHADVGARQGQAVFYLGPDVEGFDRVFAQYGVVVRKLG